MQSTRWICVEPSAITKTAKLPAGGTRRKQSCRRRETTISEYIYRGFAANAGRKYPTAHDTDGYAAAKNANTSIRCECRQSNAPRERNGRRHNDNGNMPGVRQGSCTKNESDSVLQHWLLQAELQANPQNTATHKTPKNHIALSKGNSL